MNEKSITKITLKKINKKSVYQYIYEHRKTAKQQIVQDLTMGLSMHSGTLEHICIDPEGPECYCGQKGCLETYCSANALEAAAQMPVKEFFPALRAGNDARLTEIWDAYLSHLAYAMKTANLLLDGAVIVSGYLAPYFKEEDCRTLLEKVNAASPFPLVREQLLVGTHGQYTPAIGAALLFIEEFLQSEF